MIKWKERNWKLDQLESK